MVVSIVCRFVDFEKAFDSFNREAMWKEVKRYGVPKQIVDLIKETYRGYTRAVHKETEHLK
jgi:hypothetical protein